MREMGFLPRTSDLCHLGQALPFSTFRHFWQVSSLAIFFAAMLR